MPPGVTTFEPQEGGQLVGDEARGWTGGLREGWREENRARKAEGKTAKELRQDQQYCGHETKAKWSFPEVGGGCWQGSKAGAGDEGPEAILRARHGGSTGKRSAIPILEANVARLYRRSIWEYWVLQIYIALRGSMKKDLLPNHRLSHVQKSS